jgi:hypothetical protein
VAGPVTGTKLKTGIPLVDDGSDRPPTLTTGGDSSFRRAADARGPTA